LKWVPGAQYVPHRDWNKTNFKGIGKFGKYKKITFTEEVLKFEKPKAGPHHYTTYD
jgi:hypothetical protein